MGNILVADIDPAVPEESAARSLDVAFTTEAHTKLAPMQTSATIIGLNREERARLTQQQKLAKQRAWAEYEKVFSGAIEVTEEEQILPLQKQLAYNGLQLKIEAGYQDDFAVIANAQTLPDGVKHDTTGVPTTTLTAQDGRYPWQNGFVSEEMEAGVTYRDWALIEQLSEGVLTGQSTLDEVEAAVPELVKRKQFGGYLNSRVLEGDSAARVKDLAATLGLTMYFDRGERVFLRADAVLQSEAVELRLVGKPSGGVEQATPGGLLTYTEEDRGFLSVRCLLNHRLSPGRQVLAYDDTGKQIGGGVYRVDYVKHYGSTYGAEFYSDAVLRPTTIHRSRNL